MRLFFCFLFCLLASQTVTKAQTSSVTAPTMSFNDWDKKAAQTYIDDLSKKYGTLTDADMTATRKRADDAHKDGNYPLEITERERILGKDPKNLQNLFDLAIALALQVLKEDTWRLRTDLSNVSICALQTETAQEDIAKFLFLYAHSVASFDSSLQKKALTIANSILPLSKLRETFPELQKIAPFQYTQFRFDPDHMIPAPCLLFSHPLDDKIQVRDYVTVAPVVDGAVTYKNDSVCLLGLESGKTYTVTIKAGLKSQFGETLSKDEIISLYVPDADPYVSLSRSNYILKRSDENMLPISTINVTQMDIKIYRVGLRTLPNLRDIGEYSLQNGTGELIFNDTMILATTAEALAQKNKTTVTNIDLNHAIKDTKPGLYILEAKTKGLYLKGQSEARQWIVITDVGLTTYLGDDGLYVDVRSLDTGEVKPGVTVNLISKANEVLATGVSDVKGFVHFNDALLQGKNGFEPSMIMAQTFGNTSKDTPSDFVYISLDEPAYDLTDRGVGGRQRPGSVDCFMYTDRGVYRGGETVHANAIARDTQAKAISELPVTFKLVRPDGVVAWQKQLTGNSVGHYALDLPLPEKSHTGQWSITAHTQGDKPAVSQVTFQIEDFVPARLVVNLKAPEQALSFSKALDISVESRYLFGAKASNLKADARLRLAKHPNPFGDHVEYKGFKFGLQNEDFIDQEVMLHLNSLDGEGKASLTAILNKDVKTTHPLLASVLVKVIDHSGKQQYGSLKRLALVQPAVIGIRPTFGEEGLDVHAREATFDVVALNDQGQSVSLDQVEYEVIAEDVHYSWFKPTSYGAWEYRPVVQDRPLQKGTLSIEKTTAEKPNLQKLTLTLKEETPFDQYRLIIRDTKTGAATSVRFSRGYTSSADRTNSPHRLHVVADKDKINPGETVTIHIKPSFDGHARVVVANNAIIESHLVSVSASKDNTITLTATEKWGSGAYILVNGFRPLNLPKNVQKTKATLMPKRAIGLVWIPTNTEDRVLNLTMDTPKEMRPKAKLDVPLHIQNANKKKVFVTVSAVDEGILQLTDFKTPSPHTYFYGKTVLGIELRDVYGRLIDPQDGKKGAWRSGGDMDALSRNIAALTKRSFKIVSLYQGDVTLDDEGKGHVTLDVPEFNGQLRLMAVAFDETRVGSHQETVLVREPVVIDIALPRFLTEKDTTTVPIVLTNISPSKGTFAVTVEVSGALGLDTEKTHMDVTLDKDQQHVLSIPCHGASVGDGGIKVLVTGDNNLMVTEQQEITVQSQQAMDHKESMTLLKPGETFTLTTEHTKDFVKETVRGFITLYGDAPWNIHAMKRDLNDYAYDCTEQLTSRGFAALSDMNDGTKGDVERIIRRVADQQQPSGGFSLWFGGVEDPWLTTYGYHFLNVAKEKGAGVSPTTVDKAKSFMRSKLKRLSSKPTPEDLFGVAYGLYLLLQEDQVQPGEVRYFFDQFYEQLPSSFAKGAMIATLARMGENERLTKAIEKLPPTEAAPENSTLFYGSSIRNDAALMYFVLEALQFTPDHESLRTLLTTTLEGLSAKVRNASYLSTNEKAWLILAGDALMKHKKEAPGNERKALINDKERTIHGFDSVDVNTITTVKNTGTAPLWLGLSLQGTPKQPLPAVSEGMTVTRTLLTLKGEKAAPKQLKSGESYIIVIEGKIIEGDVKENTNENPHILMVDRFAGGLDIDNPGLNPAYIDGYAPSLPYPWLEGLTPLSHREMRDDRFVASFDNLGKDGTFKIAYTVRATLPGTYIVPALTLEDMFMPSRHARTTTDTVIISG